MVSAASMRALVVAGALFCLAARCSAEDGCAPGWKGEDCDERVDVADNVEVGGRPGNAPKAKNKVRKKVKIDARKSRVWGPGLNPAITTPARYVYIKAVDTSGNDITESQGKHAFNMEIFFIDGREKKRMQVRRAPPRHASAPRGPVRLRCLPHRHLVVPHNARAPTPARAARPAASVAPPARSLARRRSTSTAATGATWGCTGSPRRSPRRSSSR